jgi:hypothetical protein
VFNISQVGSDYVDSDKESRDNKSRYILRKLLNGEISYRDDGAYGNIRCPFCHRRKVARDFDSLIMHSKSAAKSQQKEANPAKKAHHAAFGVFLENYVRGHVPFFIQRPAPLP